MRSQIEFHEATYSEISEIVDLVQSAYRGDTSRAGWTTEEDLLEGQRVDAAMVQEIIDREQSIVLAATIDGRMASCCELTHRPDRGEVYLGMFAVDPSLQASGLGRQVLARAEQIAAQRWSARRMALTVIDLRTELIAWYERRGYERSGGTGDFPYGDERFGLPLRADLRFVELIQVIN